MDHESNRKLDLTHDPFSHRFLVHFGHIDVSDGPLKPGLNFLAVIRKGHIIKKKTPSLHFSMWQAAGILMNGGIAVSVRTKPARKQKYVSLLEQSDFIFWIIRDAFETVARVGWLPFHVTLNWIY